MTLAQMPRLERIFAAVVFALMPILVQPALAQEQLWVRQFGTGPSGRTVARALATDGSGGVFVAGNTLGSLGGPSAGAGDGFLARYDRLGQRLWIRQFGTSANEFAWAATSDGLGGVFVGGSTAGALGAPNVGEYDAFLAHYDGAGNQIWIRQFGTTESEFVTALVLDGAGGIYVCGDTTGSLGGRLAGEIDAFLARYDEAGNQIWIRQFGSILEDRASSLAPDGLGGVYVVGSTQGSIISASVTPRFGLLDGYVSHYDANGTRTWTHQYGTSSDDFARAAASDGAGGVFVGGSTTGDLGGPNPSPWGFHDPYLSRYDSSGQRLWIRQFSLGGWGQALTPDGDGGVFFGGIVFDEIWGPYQGAGDPFIVRYNNAGDELWGAQFGTPREDMLYSIAFDGSGGVFVCGDTEGDLAMPNTSGGDAFLARYANRDCYLAQYADCDQSTGVGVLDLFDFLCFQNAFVNADPYACDCDTTTGIGVCDVFDFLCFQNAFVTGNNSACP